MLSILRVKNLALTENVRVSFEPGLNIITGETGAGKSVLLGALALLTGERADRTMIRTGADACGAEALFSLADSSAVDAVLEQYGLDPCVDGQLIIRRIIRQSGGNQNLVNDAPATLPVLKNIGSLLVDMHGPHDHQSLLDAGAQLDVLDRFGQLHALLDEWRGNYARWLELVRERDSLLEEQDIEGRLDLLRYQVDEIEAAALDPGEEEQITVEHEMMGHARRLQELGGEVCRLLADDEQSAFAATAGARRCMDELCRLMPEADDWRTRIDGLAGELQELNSEISGRIADIDASAQRMEFLDERLACYQSLKKKYGPSTAEVIERLDVLRRECDRLASREEQIEELDAAIDKAWHKLHASGRTLSEHRRPVARSLEGAIERELALLGLDHAAFEVLFSECEPGPRGIDAIEFMFAPNPGEESRSLRTIASSGEISRVMLAVKTVLAGHDRIPVLVFDEIDTNIGGPTAAAVGRKMLQVAGDHQVLCITHLPQVAVYGRTHFSVRKSIAEGRTYSTVQRLEGGDRVEEITRMLGGREQAAVSAEHARQMLEQAAGEELCAD